MTSITTQRPMLRHAAVGQPARRKASRLVSIAMAAVSFECVFVLFLFSGQYKADPRFEWLPLDATILFGLINAMQGMVLLCDRRFKPNPVGLPVTIAGVAFAAYVFASTTWAPGVEYAQYKAAYVATINLWCLAAGSIVISSSSERICRFLAVLIIFAAWIAIECLLFYSRMSQFGRVMQLHAMGGESAYIGLSRIVTWAAVVLASFWLLGTPKEWRCWRSSALTLGGLAFFTVTSAMIGARGPMLAAALALGLAALLYSKQGGHEGLKVNLSRLAMISCGCVVFIGAHKAWTGDYPLLIQRFLAFSSESDFYDRSGSSMMRLDLYREALKAWMERPLLGQGVGGYSVYWANVDERLFCHNLILEVLCEEGIVGLALFLLIPFAALRSNADALRETPAAVKGVLVALAATAFANTMTSGDLPDNRYLFASMGLLAFRSPARLLPRSMNGSISRQPLRAQVAQEARASVRQQPRPRQPV